MLGPVAFAGFRFWGEPAAEARERRRIACSHRGRDVTPDHNLLTQNSNR
jgi:hypothetical protein